MKLSLKPVRASRAPGFQGHYGGSQLVLTLYRMHFFCFQMCNCLPEIMKIGDAGIFPVYYSLKENREKTEEPSWGTSDNGATTAPWQLCKVHT